MTDRNETLSEQKQLVRANIEGAQRERGVTPAFASAFAASRRGDTPVRVRRRHATRPEGRERAKRLSSTHTPDMGHIRTAHT